MKMLKTSVREQAKQKRLAMTKESKQKSDSMICSKVLDLLKRMNVCQVLCYVSSYAAEISTIHVIQTLLVRQDRSVLADELVSKPLRMTQNGNE